MSTITSDRLTISNVRASFVSVHQPKKFSKSDPDDEGRYKVSLLLDPSDPDDQAQIDLIESTAAEVEKEAAFDRPLPGNRKCFGLADQDGYAYDGWAGMFYFNASDTEQPGVYGRDGRPLAEESGKPYSGCYVNAIVTLWVMDNKWGKRINANLLGVQFVRDGEAFSTRRGAPAVFDPIEEDADTGRYAQPDPDQFDDDDIPF